MAGGAGGGGRQLPWIRLSSNGAPSSSSSSSSPPSPLRRSSLLSSMISTLLSLSLSAGRGSLLAACTACMVPSVGRPRCCMGPTAMFDRLPVSASIRPLLLPVAAGPSLRFSRPHCGGGRGFRSGESKSLRKLSSSSSFSLSSLIARRAAFRSSCSCRLAARSWSAADACDGAASRRGWCIESQAVLQTVSKPDL